MLDLCHELMHSRVTVGELVHSKTNLELLLEIRGTFTACVWMLTRQGVCGTWAHARVSIRTRCSRRWAIVRTPESGCAPKAPLVEPL